MPWRKIVRYLVVAAPALFAGCPIGAGPVSVIPTNAVTPTAMTETSVRVGLYVQQHGKLPPNLAALPVRNGYTNRTTDAWNRPLDYTANVDGTFTLGSLGEDNNPGGSGLNEDLTATYRIVNGIVEQVP